MTTDKIKIVAITACAAGVAHTYMAADSLKKAASEKGFEIIVETQGTIGAENVLTPEQIAQADLVIIAADVKIDLSRFNDKKLFKTGVNFAIKNPAQLIETALEQGTIHGKKGTKVGAVTFGTTKKRGMLSHLMTGISWMIPMTIAAGILMAIANLCAFQTEYVDNYGDYGQNWVLGTRKLPQFMMDVGALGFKLMIPLFAGFTAYSIADKPGLAPAMIAGWIINDNKMLGIDVTVGTTNSPIEPGAGFIGAIVVGLLSGYLVQLLKIIRWPKVLQPIVPLMIIPILATFIMATFVKFVIGAPIAGLVLGMFDGLSALQEKFASTGIIIAIVVAIMIAFDLGGPLNKTALVFGTVIFYQTLAQAMAEGKTFWDANFIPGTATQAAISVPPLGMWLSTIIFKNRYPKNQRIMGKAAFGTGMVGITEGAIPFAAADPIRIIPANIVGSVVAAILVTLWDVKFAAGLGSPLGTFLGYIQQNSAPFWPMAWILAILAGVVTTAVIAGLLKPKIKGEEAELLKEEKLSRKIARKNAKNNLKLLFTKPKLAGEKMNHWFKRTWQNRIQSTKEYWIWIGTGIKNYFVDWGYSIQRGWISFTNLFRRKKNKKDPSVVGVKIKKD
ncbi:PTS fructose transporter subunit IIC [Spiroplasma chrysopicola]|uniref:PTS system mannose-specific IIC component n=1 Tax=Spiroplasma chrysopicola DF-1 TaxID=1276227 RepID=R4U223_9MOLU|nr:fructose-specific PTS transporter subunit EIIC [Spiroplasma chrysopicola]AGM25392.1 PTS system mannose-specific IIC component [Spiroplasma chrysopicola DF-1]